MMRFEVVVDDVVVGLTELENGDPPMGVAIGRLHLAFDATSVLTCGK